MLVDYTYEVEEITDGVYGHDQIVVKHWAILDRQFVDGLPREIGESYDLVLEPFEIHPELEGERQTDTSSVFLPAWLDIETPRLRP